MMIKYQILNKSITDVLRGIAILLVICAHVGGSLETRNYLTPMGGIGVAIFLFLSGYGLNESYKKNGLENYWLKKITRVILPYIIMQSIQLLFVSQIDWQSYLLDISFINCQYWYVSYLLECYFVFWVLTKFFVRYKILFMILWSITILLFGVHNQSEQAFSFMLGVLASINKDKIQEKITIKTLWALFIISGMCGICALALKQMPIIREYQGTTIYNMVELFIKMPIGLAFISMFHNIPQWNIYKLFSFLGVMSYELYLIHIKFRYIIPDKGVIIFICISFVLAFVFYQFNRYLIRLLKKLFF